MSAIYQIDQNGFIVEHYPSYIQNDEDFDGSSFCLTPLPQPLFLHKPRWDGEQWTEGEAEVEKTERESQQLLETLKPSPSEITDAELEIKILSMLTELEVIQ